VDKRSGCESVRVSDLILQRMTWINGLVVSLFESV
jgi:hypothetical protein